MKLTLRLISLCLCSALCSLACGKDEASTFTTGLIGYNEAVALIPPVGGYLTTPAELALITNKVQLGIEPYYSATYGSLASPDPYYYDGVMIVAGAPTYWRPEVLVSFNGSQNCSNPGEPAFIYYGGQQAYAKAIAIHLTSDTAYADAIKAKLLDLIDTTGYSNSQCRLNLSWYIPAWIWAADLIAPFLSDAEKRAFQIWLATIVYKSVDYASARRANNWGTAASATAATIADYLLGSGINLIDRNGQFISAEEAFNLARERQFDRMLGGPGVEMYSDYDCPQKLGIRSDGGLPEENRRGSTGCNGSYIAAPDHSLMYSGTNLQGFFIHAELLRRRGDSSLYDHFGLAQKAIRFVVKNPNSSNPNHSYHFTRSSTGILELGYRYYRDPDMLARLFHPISGNRIVQSVSGQMLHFTTLTHALPDIQWPRRIRVR